LVQVIRLVGPDAKLSEYPGHLQSLVICSYQARREHGSLLEVGLIEELAHVIPSDAMLLDYLVDVSILHQLEELSHIGLHLLVCRQCLLVLLLALHDGGVRLGSRPLTQITLTSKGVAAWLREHLPLRLEGTLRASLWLLVEGGRGRDNPFLLLWHLLLYRLLLMLNVDFLWGILDRLRHVLRLNVSLRLGNDMLLNLWRLLDGDHVFLLPLFCVDWLLHHGLWLSMVNLRWSRVLLVIDFSWRLVIYLGHRDTLLLHVDFLGNLRRLQL
jgi:hypothetical protein